MKVFISWSGDRSQLIAEAFRSWLPKVLQAVKPWMSGVDIDKGAKWDSSIASELSQSAFGLICLTPENRTSTAIHFEVGALSKVVENSRLWTYLYKLTYADITWPLSEFQHTEADKVDTKKLIMSINAALGTDGLSALDLDEVFETWWPKLESKLKEIPESPIPTPRRSRDDMIEEILQRVRAHDDELKLSWIRNRLSGPRAVLFKDRKDARTLTIEEIRKEYGRFGQYAYHPLIGALIYFNTFTGEVGLAKEMTKEVSDVDPVNASIQSEFNLEERKNVVQEIDELRERLFAKYGESNDSVELVREDRAR